MNKDEAIRSTIHAYEENKFRFQEFLKAVLNYFADHPILEV